MMAVKDFMKTWNKQLQSLGTLICYILYCICLRSHLTGLTQLLLCWSWEGRPVRQRIWKRTKQLWSLGTTKWWISCKTNELIEVQVKNNNVTGKLCEHTGCTPSQIRLELRIKKIFNAYNIGLVKFELNFEQGAKDCTNVSTIHLPTTN